MKVKVSFTVEVDEKVIAQYLDEFGYDDETVRDFVQTSLCCPQILDETLESALGVSHYTAVVI